MTYADDYEENCDAFHVLIKAFFGADEDALDKWARSVNTEAKVPRTRSASTVASLGTPRRIDTARPTTRASKATAKAARERTSSARATASPWAITKRT